MKSKTRLDSAVFQLTPTRTRYTLVINAKGKTEQISSGLLGPFLAHLKEAKDQVSKGCYSILLQPDRGGRVGGGGGSMWFTKGTVEGFVRFVNTPEVLERVNMTESEILQIEEAISIQDSDTLASNNEEDRNKSVEGYRDESRESIKGSAPLLNADIENMIVIYKLGEHITSNGSTGRESSRVQFLRVLETRKTVLQKEQGMAFARALAAGFDMDRMLHLVSFAECFGAPRLMEACVGFMVLWKRKHELDHRLENGAILIQSEVFADSNLKRVTTKQHEELKGRCSDSNIKMDVEGEEKSSNAACSNMYIDYNRGSGYQEFCQPLKDVPYHQINMGGSPFFQPPYPGNSESLVIRHPKDNKAEGTDSEMRNRLRQEEVSGSSHGQEQQRKGGRTSKKKSGVVVIRNLNYISSERMHDNTVGGSQSTSDPENVKESDKVRDGGRMYKKNKSVRSINSRERITRPAAKGNSYEKEDIIHVHEADSGNWQVFQNILLQHDNRDRHEHDAEHAMFASEKDVHVKRLRNGTVADPISSHERNLYAQDGRRNDSHIHGGNKVLLLNAFSDDLGSSRGELGSGPNDCLMDLHFPGSEGGKGGAASNRKMWKNSLYNVTDDSYILPCRPSLHDQAEADFRAINMDADVPSDLQKKLNVSSVAKSQLSYEPDILSLVPIHDTVTGSIGYDPSVDCEVQASSRGDVTGQTQIKEAPVIGIREMSKKLDKDKKSRALRDNAVTRKTGKLSKVTLSIEAQQARAEKIRSSKADFQKMKRAKEEEELKRLEALKKERQKRISARSSSGPAQLTLIQTRPQIKPKLYPTSESATLNDIVQTTVSLPNKTASLGSSVPQTTTKPDNLNKGGSPSQSTLPSQIRPQLQSKLSPTITYRSSKFSDSEPGPSSPLQRLRRRAASLGSGASLKTPRPNGSSSAERYPSNKPIHSASSLPNLHKPNTPITPSYKSIHSASSLPNLHKPNTAITPITPDIRRKLSYPSASSIKLGGTNSPEQKVSASGVERPSLPEKNNSSSSPTVDATQVKQSCTKSPHNRNGEDKQVIETTVVLENEIPITPITQVSVERIDTKNESFDVHNVGEKTELNESFDDHNVDEKTEPVTKYETIQTPVSSGDVKEAESSVDCSFDEKPCTPEIVAEDHIVKEQAKCSSVEISPEPHQTPPWKDLTRTSPIRRDFPRRTEAHISDYPRSSVDISSGPNHALWQEVERTPPNSSELAKRSSETKAHTPGGSPGSSVKSRVKLSSKGIRRILRFGKSSAKQIFNSDSRLISKSYLIDSFASTASSYKGGKTEENGYRRSTMTHALYIA